MIGGEIKKYLKNKGIRQSYLAKKIKYNDKTLSLMLNDKRKITADEFLTICMVLNENPSTFVSKFYDSDTER